MDRRRLLLTSPAGVAAMPIGAEAQRHDRSGIECPLPHTRQVK
jgi:hypothetical protein